ncbi:MAG: hypothetical protein DRJ42_23290 [Deltaproteobacteria bacterium]|nr:MAG: hypothetical protein DRJ42_23290 [Deltaproteobacteria bacterium]
MERRCYAGDMFSHAIGLEENTPIESELLELAAHIDAATQHFLTLIRTYDESGAWRAWGVVSCAHWLAWKCGMTTATARERVRVARALGGLPKIDVALSQGLLSYSKVRAMTRVATPENEEKLLYTAKAATAAQLEVICRGLRSTGQDPPAARQAERWVIRKRGDGDLVRIEAQLHPDEAALLMEAIDALRDEARAAAAAASASADVSAEAPSVASVPNESHNVSAEASVAPPRTSRADALVKLADLAFATSAGELEPRRTGGDRATLFVHVTDNDLAGARTAELDDGTRVPAETFRRIACDVGLVPVLTGADGQPLDVGRKTRSIPPAIRRALGVRDRTCRFPGCDHHRWLDAHHIEHWLHGGETKLGNLVLICPTHHRLLHEGGFTVTLDDQGQALFRDPEGRALTLEPAMPLGQGQAVVHLRAANENAGIRIDSHTCESEWRGERPDYDYIVARLM